MNQVWRTAAVCALAVVCAASVVSAQEQVFFVVRHAERLDAPAQAPDHAMMGPDPDLSTAGRARAARLADLLRDAAITRIFTTEYRRTRQTAAPLAERLKISPVVAAAKDTPMLLRQLRGARGRTLIVAHSNTIPEILKRLGVSGAVTIPEEQYDDLFVVVRGVGSAATLLRLKY
jgi:broad specificity phosphatase PhoE